MFASRYLSRQLPSRQWRRWAHAAAPRLPSVNADDIAHFSKFLAPSSILSTLSPNPTPTSELTTFNNDWMNKYHGKSTTVLRPRTVQEVSEIVKHCNERGIGIVPQGGNTGLVGGGVPLKDELILSLGNMNKVRSFDPVSGESFVSSRLEDGFTDHSDCEFYVGILVADAGCILESLSEFLAPHHHIVPLDLGAKGR